jgi:hypothetical protein
VQTYTKRKIDQAYELAGCARHDGDKADELRWLNEVQRLRGQPPIGPASAARAAGWCWFPMEGKWMKQIDGVWVQVDTAHQAMEYGK